MIIMRVTERIRRILQKAGKITYTRGIGSAVMEAEKPHVCCPVRPLEPRTAGGVVRLSPEA